jgi:hypothetical protein
MKLNLDDIKGHSQIYEDSCVPMSVECVLKLLKLIPVSDFSLQFDPQKSGHSNWIPPSFPYPSDNPKIEFKREFFPQDIGIQDRGSEFMEKYFEPLFKTIDDELRNNRYVIISLESGIHWHMEVIFEKNADNTYKTITFYHNPNNYKIYESQDLKQRVSNMQGTDILTYKWI